METHDDYLHELHDEYMKQVNESGMPIWLLDLYGSYPCRRKNARPLYGYHLKWSDEYGHNHDQYHDAHSMYEAMAFIENQARQFGYKTCQFTKVELEKRVKEN